MPANPPESRTWHYWPLLLALALLWLTRGLALAADLFPFNSDEAVVALMARHTLQGSPPIFFYGQAYMGSLDAFLAAPIMALIGQQPLAIRLVQVMLYSLTLIVIYHLSLRWFESRFAAGATVLLMAIPTVLVTLYTTVSLGGYGEMLLAGHLLMLWMLRLRTQPQAWLEWLGWGALAGVAFWAFGFVGVYLAPAGLALIWPWLITRQWRPLALRLALLTAGFVLGSAPWVLFTLQNGLATFSELTGSHIADPNAPPLPLQWLFRLFSLLLFGTTAISGLRAPWSVEFLALPLSPIGLGLTLAALAWGGFQLRETTTHPKTRLGLAVLFGVLLTNSLGFIFTSFGNDPSGRYFLPFWSVIALMGGGLLAQLHAQRAMVARAALGLWLAFNLITNGIIAFAYLQGTGPGFTTQFDRVAQVDRRYDAELQAFLRQNNEYYGYGNYWVTFPLAFLSGEDLQYAARLPYHHSFAYTPRDDRYPPYTQAAATADKVAYITTNHPTLNDYLRAQFTANSVTFSETTIGSYTVFYALSRPIHPSEMGLGSTTDGFNNGVD